MKRQIEYERKDSRGTLIQIATGDFKVLKHIKIKAGKKFGGHFHTKSTEVFYVLFGKIQANVGNFIQFFEAGDCFEVSVGLVHTLEAFEDSELIEVATGEFDKGDVIYPDAENSKKHAFEASPPAQKVRGENVRKK